MTNKCNLIQKYEFVDYMTNTTPPPHIKLPPHRNKPDYTISTLHTHEFVKNI